jgi:ubiquinone/menaquinone biosynthesis C-methylase UbiE
MEKRVDGSGSRWGPLFGARARVWADTWEGGQGWGTRVYEHVLAGAGIGPGTAVLDCGCGAGRFVSLAAERGADVAGIDAAKDLVEIAASRSPRADLRVGDIESLPWPDDSFDVVTGFSTFQFADDHIRALAEARRVSRGGVWVVVPTRLTESGIPQVFAPLMALFSPEVLPILRRSGMFALSAPGRLEEALASVGMSIGHDDTVESTVAFSAAVTAVDAFLSAGATALAVEHSGQPAVERAIYQALDPFSDDRGRVTLPGWYRVVAAS